MTKRIKSLSHLIVLATVLTGTVTAFATPPPPPPPPIGSTKAKIKVSASMFQGDSYKGFSCEFETTVFIYENVPLYVNRSVMGEECRGMLGALNFKAEVGIMVNRNTQTGKKEILASLLARTTEGDWDSQSLIRGQAMMIVQDSPANDETVNMYANGFVYQKPLSERNLRYVDVHVTGTIE